MKELTDHELKRILIDLLGLYGKTTISALAERLGSYGSFNKANVGKLLVALEAEGLVARERHQLKVTRWRLTP